MGSISLATSQWKQPFPHHMSLKTFVNICCFQRVMLYQGGTGHRLVKWALNSSVLASWGSLFLLRFSSLFCSWKSEVGKVEEACCCFLPAQGCRADRSLRRDAMCLSSAGARALLPKQKVLFQARCRLRVLHCFSPNHILQALLALHWVTSECHFFPCWVSPGFLNSAGVPLRFYGGILKGVQDWDHPNATKTQGVRHWAPTDPFWLLNGPLRCSLLMFLSQSSDDALENGKLKQFYAQFK